MSTITPEMIRKVGVAAEDKVRGWANPGSMTAHPPSIDERGWDFIFEYDIGANDSVSMDKSEFIATCKIQAKGTYDDSGSVEIALSNWKYMVTQSLPFFVAVVVFGLNDIENPTAVYLIHIDKDYVEKVLRRLRELDIKSSQLNKKVLVLNWNQSHRLQSPFGASMGKKIREYIGPSAEAYLLKKIGWLKQVGYDDFPINGSISFHCPDDTLEKSYDQLADLAVGILEELPIDQIEMNETRFGISKPISLLSSAELPDLESTSIKLDPLPTLGTTRVTIGDIRNESLTSIKCDTYMASAVFKFLPPNKNKCRLVSPFITFVMKPPSDPNAGHAHIRITVKIPEAVTLTLCDLARTTKALEILLKEQGNGLMVRFDFSEQSHRARDGRPDFMRVPLGPYSMNFPAKTDSLLTLAQQIRLVSSSFQLDDQIQVSLDKLLKQSERLGFMCRLLQGVSEKPEVISVSFEKNNKSDDVQHKRTAILATVGVMFGKQLLIVVSAIGGLSELATIHGEEGRECLLIKDTRNQILKKFQIILEKDENYSTLPLLEASRAELFSNGYEIVFEFNTGKAWVHDNLSIGGRSIGLDRQSPST